MRVRSRVLVPVLAVGGLTVAACSGSDGDTAETTVAPATAAPVVTEVDVDDAISPTDTEAPEPTDAPTTTAAEAEPDAEPSAEEVSPDQAPDPITEEEQAEVDRVNDEEAVANEDMVAEAPAALAGVGTPFCDFVGRAAAGTAPTALLDTLDAGPAELGAAMGELRGIVEELALLAPSAIADDVAVYSDPVLDLVVELEEADFEIIDADIAFFGDAETQMFAQESATRIDAFAVEQCGDPIGIAESA